MTKRHFSNALNHYIINDQMQSAIKLVNLATQLEISTILNIICMVDMDSTVERKNHNYYLCLTKLPKPTTGQRIYTELMNESKRYSFEGWQMKHRIKMFNFKLHFENI